MLADALLRESGDGGLLAWALDQRRAVHPPSWDEVAARLVATTEGKVRVRGQMLRHWLKALEEQERSASMAGE